MNKTDILDFITANPVFHLATIEGDRPRVRGMLMYRADENGIIFHTGKMRELHKQLTENPQVEISFNNGSQENLENLVQVRVSGSVEPVEDMGLKKEIVRDRVFLKPFVEQYGYDQLAVYCLKKGVASVWTMAENLAQKEQIAF